MRNQFLIACLAVLSLCAPAYAATFKEAFEFAQAGRADDAMAALKSVLATSPSDDRAQSLLCTVEVTLEKYDDAIRACETATRIAPASSKYQLALARAYGAKADHAGALTGMRLVGKIRDAFQKAVQLDPVNVEAMSDLGEFYVDAPSIVGGGTDKAKTLVPKLMIANSARGHRLLGMIATKDGDAATAQAEFEKELAIGHTPEAYVDLANFYSKRKDWSKAATFAVEAIHRDTQHGPDSVDAANILVRLSRNVDVAQQAYRDYLASSQQSAGVPAFRIHTLLGQTLLHQGDKAAAQKEFSAALALAHEYGPAREGMTQ